MFPKDRDREKCPKHGTAYKHGDFVPFCDVLMYVCDACTQDRQNDEMMAALREANGVR